MTVMTTQKVDFRVLDRSDMPVANYDAGATIFEKGDTAKEMFLVRKGRIAIQIDGETVEEVETGGILGEMALIDFEPRSASAVVIEDAEIIPIDERLFVILVQDAPFFALDVMRVLTDRVRHMNQRL
jgi:CRP/FNR family transcriptional regulator, cyclic AMP receptor protein